MDKAISNSTLQVNTPKYTFILTHPALTPFIWTSLAIKHNVFEDSGTGTVGQ